MADATFARTCYTMNKYPVVSKCNPPGRTFAGADIAESSNPSRGSRLIYVVERPICGSDRGFLVVAFYIIHGRYEK